MIQKLRLVLGSIALKILVAVGLISATGLAAVVVSGVAFKEVDAHFTDLVDEQVQGMRRAVALTGQTDQLRDGAATVLFAQDEAALRAAMQDVDERIASIDAVIALFPADEAAALAPLVTEVRDGLAAMAGARRDAFAARARMVEIETVLNSATTDASNVLGGLADDASFELEIGAEDKIAVLDRTLNELFEQDFAKIEALYRIRAEVNLLSGAAIASVETRDVALHKILADLSAGAIGQLRRVLPRAEALGVDPQVVSDIGTAVDYYASLDTGAAAAVRSHRAGVLDHRQAVDVITAETIDDLIFDLVLSVEAASATNETAIRDLLNTQLARIRLIATLDDKLKSFSIAALEAGVAQDEADLAMAADRLTSAFDAILALRAEAPAEVQVSIDRLVSVADPETGILSARRTELAATAEALVISQEATAAVAGISARARARSEATVEDIATAAADIAREIGSARADMRVITGAGALFLLATLVFLPIVVLRPLTDVSRETERLAGGDHGPVSVRLASGEIRRMVRALVVFRDNLIETERMRAEDTERTERQRAAERRAQEEARARDERDRAEKAEHDRERRAMKEAQDAEREQSRLATERDRTRAAEAQKAVVTALAEAMEGLARGALTTRITVDFPEGYEALRDNFNAAMVSLEQAMIKVSHSGEAILGNTIEISRAAEDLSRRTETSSATLAQTSAALTELTGAVSEVASGAASADDVVRRTREGAMQNEAVVRDTISAMAGIDESSTKIARIIDVIDDIAFQTNLLALNAGVEAARAGEAGRGFAVVATEVRSLAQRSADAAKEISELIRESGDQVKEGVRLVDKTGAALKSIVDGIGAIADEVSRIAVSTSEQSNGIGEINRAVEQLDRVIQQNAAMFEQTTAATHSLNNEARAMSELLSGFEVARSVTEGVFVSTQRERRSA